MLGYLPVNPLQQHGRIRAAPEGICIRKEMTDISQRQRAKQRIGQCMQGDIAIGMRFQPLTVGNTNTTEHDVIALAKGMHIKALTNTNGHDRDSCFCRSR